MSERIEIVDETDYIGSVHVEEFEDGSQMIFVHMDVYYWGPSILKKMIAQWPVFRASLASTPLFCMGTVDDAKFEKYVTRFGFEYLSDIPCTDGQVRRLYVNQPTV
jgi:hypothetical protein